MQFAPFDYANPPADGIYWVAGCRPEVDIDADDYGQTIGTYTGAELKFTALVWITQSAEDGLEFSPVDSANMGRVCDTDTVTHFAPFELPAYPQTERAVEES